MADRFDQRGYLVRQVFGMRKRRVFCVPGEVSTRLWRFSYGASVQAQSLALAHELLDQYLDMVKI